MHIVYQKKRDHEIGWIFPVWVIPGFPCEEGDDDGRFHDDPSGFIADGGTPAFTNISSIGRGDFQQKNAGDNSD